jgi:transcriptional enhancer factor
MIQPTPIVPSNAPPQHDTIGSHHSSRVLQEHSGNRQQNDYSYHAPSEQKHQPAHQIENTYQGYQIPRPLPIYQQTPLQQRNAYRHFARRCVEKHDDPIELRRKVRYLLQRCHGCEAFSKYRERLVKGHKPGAEQIWPERLEFALFEGKTMCFE